MPTGTKPSDISMSELEPPKVMHDNPKVGDDSISIMEMHDDNQHIEVDMITELVTQVP